MKRSGETKRAGHKRRLLVPAAIAAAALGVASAAWACTPAERDSRTKLSNCTAPAGSTKVCKPLLGTTPFPEATAVKGPAGSRIVAYTESGSTTGQAFDLLFADKIDLADGEACFQSLTKLGGPSITDGNGGIPPTIGTIPSDAPLGGGEVCFSDTASRTANEASNSTVASGNSTVPAVFKVIV